MGGAYRPLPNVREVMECGDYSPPFINIQRTQRSRHSDEFSRLASIKVMQRTFNPQNRARYPGGPPILNSAFQLPICNFQFAICFQNIAASFNSKTAPFEGAHVGATPAAAANFKAPAYPMWTAATCRRFKIATRRDSFFSTLGSETESRLAYIQKSGVQLPPARPFRVQNSPF